MKKVNLGCGSRPLEGYINIDQDSAEVMQHRYPDLDIPNIPIHVFSVFDLPFKDEDVDEVRFDSLIEHLSFKEEKPFLEEVYRVLKPGGVIKFETPDFEDTCKKFLAAEDWWKDFYRDDEEAIRIEHWFGQNSYRMDQRWGYLTASIFGSQSGEGQFHKNCYTEGKIRRMLGFMLFHNIEISKFYWKENRDLMLKVIARKS